MGWWWQCLLMCGHHRLIWQCWFDNAKIVKWGWKDMKLFLQDMKFQISCNDHKSKLHNIMWGHPFPTMNAMKVDLRRIQWFATNVCHNPSFGFATKARGMERWGLKMQPNNHIHIPGNAEQCEGMNSHIPKLIPTLGVGVLRDFRIIKEQFEGSKFIGLKNSLYHWKTIEM
jgi:hypothetical protein